MIFPFFFNDMTCNSYVVGEFNEGCILIDNGCEDDRIIDFIDKNFSFCAGVLLTHGHFDHIKGLKKFLKKFNCTIFIKEEDLNLLNNCELNCSKFFFNKEVNVNTNNYYVIDDDDEINFFDKYYIKVIATPFHTNGSVCYLLKNENALFTGDTLFKENIGRYDLPTSNEKLIYESLKKIMVLDENLNVYPGHGEVTTLKYELENNYYLRRIKK